MGLLRRLLYQLVWLYHTRVLLAVGAEHTVVNFD